jgi:hypothetical protein
MITNTLRNRLKLQTIAPFDTGLPRGLAALADATLPWDLLVQREQLLMGVGQLDHLVGQGEVCKYDNRFGQRFAEERGVRRRALGWGCSRWEGRARGARRVATDQCCRPGSRCNIKGLGVNIALK